MAKDYKKIYEEQFGKSNSPSQLQKNQKSINNLKAQLTVGGVDPNEALDKRNFIEKKLNLTPNQNAIFDIFEILNRPQQALFGGIESVQKGEDFSEGAKQGIKGNKKTQFKDILMNTGAFDDTTFNETSKETDSRLGALLKSIDLVDVLGTAGDIFLDPADIIPVAGFSKINKALDGGEGLLKAVKSGDSLSDLAFKGAGKLVKGTAKGADNLIEKGLSKLDAVKGVKAYDNLGNALPNTAKVLYGNLDGAKRATELMPIIANKADIGSDLARIDKGRLQSYKELKDSISDVFKKSKVAQNAILTKRAAENTANEVKLKIGNILKQNEDIVKNYAETSGKDLNKASENISLFIESLMDRSIEKDELLDLIREGKVYTNANIEKALKEMQDQIVNQVSKISNIPVDQVKSSLDLSFKTDDKGLLKLTGNGWNKNVLKENGITSFKDLDEASSVISDYGNWYTKSDLEEIEELKKDEDFRKMINQIFGEIKDGDKIVFDGDNVKILSNFDVDPKGKYGPASDLHSELQKQIPSESIGKERGYAGGGYYRTINDTLNAGGQLTGEAKRVADNVESAINAYKTTEPLGLTKYDKAKHVRQAFGLPELAPSSYDTLSVDDLRKTADELQDKIGQKFKVSEGFNSAAIGAGSSYFTDKDTYMKIRAADGTNMFIVNPNEREAILKKAQEYTLKSAAVEDVMTEFGPKPKLVLTVDIFDDDGKLLATIGDNKAANDLNKIVDEGFETNFSRFNEGNASNAWLPHTLADKSMVDATKDIGIPIFRGNTSLISHRTRLGSLRENNNLYRNAFTKGKVSEESAKFFEKYPKLFEENFNKAFANKYYDGMINLAKQHKIVNDALIDQTFGSRKEIEALQKTIQESVLSGNKKALKEATDKYNKFIENSPVKYLTEYDSTIPNNFTRITGEQADNIKNHLLRIRQAVGADESGYNKLLDIFDKSKGSIAVDNDVLRMLQVTIDPKQKNAILNAYDKVLDLYKSTKTLSFTNALNNFVGNSSNLYLSGISPVEQAKYMSKAVDIAKNGQDLYTRKLAGEVLSKKENKIADIWKKFIDTGFGNEEIALDLQDLPDFMKDIAKTGKTNKKISAKEVATWLPRMNMRANTYVDNLNRITVMLKSMDDPSFLRRLGIDGATDVEKYRKAISKVMFDPTMMTDAEKNIMKRIIPFYTYAKNNLVFQMDNLGRNGSRYNKLVKTIKNLQKSATGNNEEDMEDYLKNSLYVPIPGLDKDGNYKVLRAQLPFGDILELAEDPISNLSNKTGPIIKGPIEYATNKNAFTGLDIEKFPGQKSTNIPFLTKRQEKLLGDLTGLDVPIKTGARLFSSDPLNSIIMTNNVNTDKLNKSYEEIEDLQNLMKQYEQKGYQFSTISELKKANKNKTIANIDAILAKYGVGEKIIYDTGNKYYDYYMNNYMNNYR